MSVPSRFRFTLGQWMGVVAVSAVFLAAATLSLSGDQVYLIAISYASTLAGAGVLLYNTRLSGWMWIALAGYAGPAFLGIVMKLASAMSPSSLNGDMIVMVYLALGSVFNLLFVVGLAMTFRDIRRRLTDREG